MTINDVFELIEEAARVENDLHVFTLCMKDSPERPHMLDAHDVIVKLTNFVKNTSIE